MIVIVTVFTLLLCMILEHMAPQAFVLFSYRKKKMHGSDWNTNKTDVLLSLLDDFRLVPKAAYNRIPVYATERASNTSTKCTVKGPTAECQ